MQLTYFNNKTDARYVDKKLETISKEGHSNPVTIKILDSTNLAHPTFKMSDADLYMTANYCYVDDLRRYYFIDSIDLENGYALLHCTCDVLSTYKVPLRAQTVILKRSEKVWDRYQNDGELPVEQRVAKRCIGKFTTPFQMSTNAYVMGVVGNTSGGEENGGE